MLCGEDQSHVEGEIRREGEEEAFGFEEGESCGIVVADGIEVEPQARGFCLILIVESHQEGEGLFVGEEKGVKKLGSKRGFHKKGRMLRR